jgi:glycosyltransferase involved in cell wall biosynthesis
MKITIVLGAFFPVPPLLGGAVEKVWFALGKEFAKQGHEVVQISRSHPQLPREEMIDGVRHIRVTGFAQPRSIIWLKWLDLIYSLRVTRVLPPADILVTNTFWLPLLVRCENAGRLYVHVQRGPKGQMRWYSRAARLCAVSNAIAEKIVAEAPQLRDKVRVIPNALPSRIETGNSHPRERVILFVGRIHPEKGIELLLRGVTLLSKELRATWKVRIIGPHEIALGGGGDVFLFQMKELAATSGIEVEWLGKIFDADILSAHYRSCMVFTYPSIAESGEALPVAPLEAMAHGCVPVVSNLECFRDYIINGVNGFVFDHRATNPARALADGLTELLEAAPDEWSRLSQAARAKAAEFDVSRIAKRYLDDFASLL